VERGRGLRAAQKGTRASAERKEVGGWQGLGSGVKAAHKSIASAHKSIGNALLSVVIVREMEFPYVIWCIIMSYFHSVYRRPPHLHIMLSSSTFYFTRNYHRTVNKYQKLWDRTIQIESYYMRLIAYSVGYATSNQLEPKIRRGVAVGVVREEFIEIFRIYRTRHPYNLINPSMYYGS
jgi:hypothetical protein